MYINISDLSDIPKYIFMHKHNILQIGTIFDSIILRQKQKYL